jgi:septum formation protein
VTAPRRAPGALFYSGSAPIVLASASPRRVTLLRQVGLAFTVVDPGPDRDWPGKAEPRHGVRALALEKARRVAARRPEALVIGADTVVVARGSASPRARPRRSRC